ncbi:ABC transporter ATP-binding protein [Subtercola frigoramans]|uniref:ABC-2 type transport system ATP-binding protein n=1 Tax=Subtercola frigoramans TaxID=120298 RepID=A0ABS2L4A3_9MICO|nr:ABC transporter ATP-binding protein [Subtercola frigoramans]MBM7471575.1 ABC-2 type transport system ATP-binding protein [Subtercola frigoramans]
MNPETARADNAHGGESPLPVIHARGLVKRFGRVTALDGLDLSVAPGEVHGFLGPNGSGKSTTIRILLGLARADGGSVEVFGEDPWAAAVSLHRRIAYVPGDVTLWPNLTGGEAIDLLTRLRAVRGPGHGHGHAHRHGHVHDSAARRTSDERDAVRRRDALIDAFDFDPGKKGRAYSKGNRQKVALIAAFATPAELYILDEPTSGLDPVMESVFAREVTRVTNDGAAVLLSSHILSEVEELCDRVTIIRAGATVETGTLADLRHLTRTEVSFSSAGMTDARLATLTNVHDLRTADGRVFLTVDSTQLVAALPQLADLEVTGLTIAPPSLEELFLHHYGDAPAAPPALAQP